MVVLGFSILGLPPAVANALGFSGLSPLNEPLRAAQLVSAAMGVVAIPLLAWMMVAALRRGPWATRRLAGQ
jgi:hypothetical protein